jgi:hypothetical protein
MEQSGSALQILNGATASGHMLPCRKGEIVLNVFFVISCDAVTTTLCAYIERVEDEGCYYLSLSCSVHTPDLSRLLSCQ